MATAFVIAGLGTILFWIAVIALLLVILSKDKENCKVFLLTYLVLAYFYGITCGVTANAESRSLFGDIPLIETFIGFTKIFLFTFLIANIPSLIMFLIYQIKFYKEAKV